MTQSGSYAKGVLGGCTKHLTAYLLSLDETTKGVLVICDKDDYIFKMGSGHYLEIPPRLLWSVLWLSIIIQYTFKSFSWRSSNVLNITYQNS